MSIAETEERANSNFAASVPPATRAAEPNQAVAAEATRSGSGGSPPHREASAESRLIGTPDQILRRLRDYASVGVTEMCVIFYSPNVQAMEEQTRFFATQVIANW